MANTHEHLTTAQLSAFIDTQLSTEEETICKVHLQTCEQCQGRLASLQQASTLLRAMPQPDLPRSFALPTGVRYLQDRPAVETRFIAPHQQTEQQEEGSSPPARRRLWTYYIRRSLRASSTIAAVIGLVFLLSGVLPLLPHSGTTTSTSAPSVSSANNHAQSTNQTTPNLTATHKAQIVGSGQAPTAGKLTPKITPRPANTPGLVRSTPEVSGHQNGTPPPQPRPPIVDLNTPLGRQEVGFALFFLGIVGVLLTRRRQQRQT